MDGAATRADGQVRKVVICFRANLSSSFFSSHLFVSKKKDSNYILVSRFLLCLFVLRLGAPLLYPLRHAP